MSSQCVTSPTRTLYGTTVNSFGGGGGTTSTITYYTTLPPVDQTITSSICSTASAVNGTGQAVCAPFTTTLLGTPGSSSSVAVITGGSGSPSVVTSVFPTATEYTTVCTAGPTSIETLSTPESRPTSAPPVSVTTKVEVSVAVSSAAVSVTDAQGRVSVSVRVVTVLNTFSSAVPVETGGTTTLASKSSSTPIGAIVGGVAGGLALVGALIVFLVLRRKRRVSQTAGVNDDDDDMYGVSRRASGRGEKGEKRRLDLVEDTNPGFVQPFTYSDPSTSTGYHPYGSSSSTSPGIGSGSIDPFAAAGGGAVVQASMQAQSPPRSMTSAQAKALEALRSRSPQSVTSGGYSTSDAGPSQSMSHPVESPSMEPDEVVVHQDAGPARIELPPMYADRS